MNPRNNRCRIQDDLVSELTALSSKLNRPNPTWVRSEAEQDEIQKRRETLQVELKQHRKKGHNGTRYPGFNPPRYSLSAAR
jgi:hypothetical protein